jgi:primosomal protein N' (replication factor Y)
VGAVPPEKEVQLTAAQAAALGPIESAITESRRAAFLLRGVTGSGKTEVYLRAIRAARALGKSAIVLVPEIALTSQLESRFVERFGSQVAVLHSALGDAERRARWERLRSGEATIALGPRSAVWAPVQSLGVVVVDEEHDPSFKQQSELRYNGRDLALLRAHRAGGVAILGSATPALETRQLARTGRLVELVLPERATGRRLPAVRVVDLAEEQRALGGEIPLLSRPLGDGLREIIARKEQAILFLNRRGFNTIVVCDDCAEPRSCPECSVALTHHKARALLLCHYCGHQEPLDRPCKRCGLVAMKPYGAGTERVGEEVLRAVPEARVVRLDRDTTPKLSAIEETLGRFRARQADVLVGTQMVAKGHDFPAVTLVGIICADTSLAFPDFRAAERTFQLLTQVAGRAGRAELEGRVVIQTFQPEHYALTHALRHDDQGFFEIEAAVRRGAGYPPFTRMGLLRAESVDLEACRRIIERAAALARRSEEAGVAVRGPVPAPLERIKGRWRQMLMFRAPTPARLVAAMRTVKEQLGPVPRNVELIYDLDPVDLL